MSVLAKRVLEYIRKQQLLRPGDRVGVAVSGGADSVALLRILVDLRQQLGLVLRVVHLNHSIRGEESDADEQFVRDLASRYDLDFFSETRNAKAYAVNNKLSLEAAARAVRYQFFEDVLCQGSLDKTATAHTLDDQAETVLLKLLRGAGTRGLAGIYPKVNLPRSGPRPDRTIVRPFLAVSRVEIEAHLRDLKQPWREDSSNRDLKHKRNLVRNQVLPNLEREVNPGVREVLADVAEIARAEEHAWNEQVANFLPLVSKRFPAGIALGGRHFVQAGLALQRRLIRATAESLGLTLQFLQVEEVLSPASGRVTLSMDWSMVHRNGEIRFERGPIANADYEYPLVVPGRTIVPEVGFILELKVIKARSVASSAASLLDASFSGQQLRVRSWRPGDRFWPTHSKQVRKVKELLQDRHITGTQKGRWPVIISGDTVLWMRGFGVHRQFQAKDRGGLLIKEVEQVTGTGP